MGLCCPCYPWSGPVVDDRTALLDEDVMGPVYHQHRNSIRTQRFAQYCSEGDTFIKHGRHGVPHPRQVVVNLHEGVVDWGTKTLKISEIVDVRPGKTTKVFLKNKKVDPDLCFSFITENPNRTLDLQCSSYEQCELWVQGLRRLILGLEDNNLCALNCLLTPEEYTKMIQKQQALAKQARLTPTTQDEQDEKEWIEFLQIAAIGAQFTKFGRRGKPHIRTVRVSDGCIRWGTGTMSLTGAIVQVGCQTPIFEKQKDSVDPSLCFSLIGNRTLDLQASDKNQRNLWVRGLVRYTIRHSSITQLP